MRKSGKGNTPLDKSQDPSPRATSVGESQTAAPEMLRQAETIPAQAAMLKRLLPVQRQSLFRQIGQGQGNQHAQKVSSTLYPPTQRPAALLVNEPGDRFEQEADTVADRVVGEAPDAAVAPPQAPVQERWSPPAMVTGGEEQEAVEGEGLGEMIAQEEVGLDEAEAEVPLEPTPDRQPPPAEGDTQLQEGERPDASGQPPTPSALSPAPPPAPEMAQALPEWGKASPLLAMETTSSEAPDSLGEKLTQIQALPASEVAPAMATLREEVPTMQAEQRATLEASLPRELPVPSTAPRPPQGTPSSEPPAPDKSLTLVEQIQSGVTQAHEEEHAVEPAPPPVPERPALAAKQTEQCGDAAQEADQKQRQANPERAQLHSHVPLSAGPRPAISLTGAADPAPLDAHHHASTERLAEQQSHLTTLLHNQDFGERALEPPALTAPIPLELELPTAPAIPAASQPIASSSAAPTVQRTPLDGQEAGAVDGLEAQIAPTIQAQLAEMQAAHEAEQAAFTDRLQDVRAQGELAMQDKLTETRTAHAAMEQDAQRHVADERATWLSRQEAIGSRHAASARNLHQEATGFIESQVQESQSRTEQRLTQAKQRALQRKVVGEEQAQATLQRGQEQATSILAGVSEPFHGGYEAQAVQHSGILMRQGDPRDVNPLERNEEEQRAAVEAARQAAQNTMNDSVAEAQRSVDALVAEVNALMAEAATATAEDLQRIEQLIAARLEEVNAILDVLEERAATETTGEAASAIMRINMHVLVAMSSVLDLQTTLPATLQTTFQQHVAAGYQAAYADNLANSTYYIFVAAPDVDVASDPNNGGYRGSSSTRYLNMPFSQMAGTMLNGEGVSAGQMMYLNGNNEAAIAPGQEQLIRMMNTLAIVNPQAEFVLSGHSRGANIVLSTADTLLDTNPDAAARIIRLLAFDPHVGELFADVPDSIQTNLFLANGLVEGGAEVNYSFADAWDTHPNVAIHQTNASHYQLVGDDATAQSGGGLGSIGQIAAGVAVNGVPGAAPPQGSTPVATPSGQATPASTRVEGPDGVYIATTPTTRHIGYQADQDTNGAGLPLRPTASSSGNPRTRLPGGTSVQVLGYSEDGSWAYVEVNGQRGWVGNAYLVVPP